MWLREIHESMFQVGKNISLNTDDTENYCLFLGDVFRILNLVCLFVFNPHSYFCCPKLGKMRGRDHGRYQS